MPLSIPGEKACIKANLASSGLISNAINWIQDRQAGRFSKRRLQVAETVSLGEKRFVAVIQIDGYQYLVGGGATNVALLAKLNSKESFQEMLQQNMSFPESRLEIPGNEHLREKA